MTDTIVYAISATMVADPTPYEALVAAVEVAGSQSALARSVSISSTAVWKWVQSSKRVPADYVLKVEAATGISRHYLRPDIYPVDLTPHPQPHWPGLDKHTGSRFVGVDRRSRYGNPQKDLDKARAAQ